MPVTAQTPIRILRFYGVHQRQSERFDQLAPHFASVHGALAEGPTPLPLAAQEAADAGLAQTLLPMPPKAFLQSRELQRLLVFSSSQEAVNSAFSEVKAYLAPVESLDFLQEDIVGDPSLIDHAPAVSAREPSSIVHVVTSPTRIWSAHQLVRYELVTKRFICDAESILVCGARYGDIPRLLRRRNAFATILLIDTPLRAALQWLYLSSVIGEQAVHLISDSATPIREGFINIMTFGTAAAMNVTCELFVAIWSSRDVTAGIQELVFERNLFGAKHFAVGFADDGSGVSLEVRRRATQMAAVNGLEGVPQFAFL
jgi:hypothetical protein